MFLAVWTAVDACGHALEIYGSGGWGFEFLRACHGIPVRAGVSSRRGSPRQAEVRSWESFSGAIRSIVTSSGCPLVRCQ